METKTTMPKPSSRKGQLIRRLHTLRGAVGMTQGEYEALLGSYGVESSKELSPWQLERLCDFLQQHLGNAAADKDGQRKRLLAAVCAFCEDVIPGWEAMASGERMDYAKGVACRAAQVSGFNRIGTDRLRSLTYAFQKRRRDMDSVVATLAGTGHSGGKEVSE